MTNMDRLLSVLLDGVTVLSRTGSGNPVVNAVVFDSREVAPGALFVATRGTATDGHRFINAAIEKGAVAVVCEVLPNVTDANVPCVTVSDSSAALGLIASAFYGNPSRYLKVVGVTGTNGKTTIATLMHRLVGLMGHKAGLFSTVANYIVDRKLDSTHTTPDAVSINKYMAQMVMEGCEYCFMEVSSHAVDQKRIAGLAFAGGIFTNLTHDHLDYHKTFDAYLKAKKLFFDQLEGSAFALVNLDDKHGRVMLQNTKASTYTFSTREMADFKARIIESMFEGMQLDFGGKEFYTPFVGQFNASNLLAVYGAIVLLGFSPDEVLVALSKLTPVDGRFETIRSPKGVTAIVDYAHTPDALKNVIETINDIRQVGQQLITVVGAGGDRDKTKRPVMAKEAVKGSNKVVLTSDNPRSENPDDIILQMMEGVDAKEKIKVLCITNRREAIRTACMLAGPGDIILVAGKGHETYQEIQGVKHHFDDREEIRRLFDEQTNLN